MKKLFLNDGGRTVPIGEAHFKSEKELQKLVENNLDVLFDARFLKTEYQVREGRRIDTLGFDGVRPVIIEYKKSQNQNVVGQTLSYFNAFISKKKDAFELLIMRRLGHEKADKINWQDTRLICIAQAFNDDDYGYLDGSQQKKNVELVTYRYFNNKTLLFEWVHGTPPIPSPIEERENIEPAPIPPPVPPAPPPPNPPNFARLVDNFHKTVKGIGPGIEHYQVSAYEGYKKHDKIFLTFGIYPSAKYIRVWLPLDPGREKTDGENLKDMSKTRHNGMGDLEILIDSEAVLSKYSHLLRKSYYAASPTAITVLPKGDIGKDLRKCSKETQHLFFDAIEALMKLEERVSYSSSRRYVAFKKGHRVIASIANIAIRRGFFRLYLQVNPEEVELREGFTRDMRKIKHNGIGNLEVTIRNMNDVRDALSLFRKAYEKH